MAVSSRRGGARRRARRRGTQGRVRLKGRVLASLKLGETLSVSRGIEGQEEGAEIGGWRTKRKLGDGANSEVWEVERASGQRGDEDETDEVKNKYVAKVVNLQEANEAWNASESLEKEARVLKELNHPGIPSFVDFFVQDVERDGGGETGTQSNRMWVLIVEASGPNQESLANRIEGGEKMEEAMVLDIGVQLLSVLSYLERLNPPVTHRDIKPDNVTLDANGKVQLIDFGAVQERTKGLKNATLQTSVVGTFGFMPLEQLRGTSANSISDQYACGATLLYLLTGRNPQEFEFSKLKIKFRKSVNVSNRMADALERMLEPAPEDRFRSNAAALKFLLRNSSETTVSQDEQLRLALQLVESQGIRSVTSGIIDGVLTISIGPFSTPFVLVGAELTRESFVPLIISETISVRGSRIDVMTKLGPKWIVKKLSVPIEDLIAIAVTVGGNVVESWRNLDDSGRSLTAERYQNGGGNLGSRLRDWLINAKTSESPEELENEACLKFVERSGKVHVVGRGMSPSSARRALDEITEVLNH